MLIKTESNRYRVGVDVGGTFTDIVVIEEGTGRILATKVPTTPTDPADGCIFGIKKCLDANRIDPKEVAFVVHGTTVATNTIIEGKAAKAGLITSFGFRDVLEIAYQTRPSLYDVFYDKPKPLIPRYLCVGVPERQGPLGEILVPLDEAAVRLAARRLAGEDVEAVAIAFLHSYRDATHERRASEIFAEECPTIPVMISSDVCPEFREYPRTSTTVVNAVLLPRVGPYIERFRNGLHKDAGIDCDLHLMSSAGGIISADIARQQPVHLIESGPAAGVLGAAFVAKLSGVEDLLSLDIGGTTAKAAVVRGGEPQIADEFEVGASAVASVTAQRGQGYPVRTPVISLVEIGAGGGSIAYIDAGGALKVGPQSAGAVPGPACYGQGGKMPTLTDANLVLGRIDPEYFLGGESRLQTSLAENAIRTHVAKPLGLSVIEAARSVIAIANAKMAGAFYFITIEKGIDPRDFVLVASGGAGPMHAVAIAAELSIPRVFIPPTPGLNSALGLLATDLKHEFVRTLQIATDGAGPAALSQSFGELEDRTRLLLKQEGANNDSIQIRRTVDMCYVGQSYHLKIPILGAIGTASAETLSALFHDEHEKAYGFCNRAERTQLVNARLVGSASVSRPNLRPIARGSGRAVQAAKTPRKVYFSETNEPVDCPIYERSRLLAGDRFSGPAIVEQMDSTIVVPPGWYASVDTYGSLVIEPKHEAA